MYRANFIGMGAKLIILAINFLLNKFIFPISFLLSQFPTNIFVLFGAYPRYWTDTIDLL